MFTRIPLICLMIEGILLAAAVATLAPAALGAPPQGSLRAGLRRAHLTDPIAVLRQEQLVGHGQRQLAALHRLGAFVRRFELRVHPLVTQEAGTIFGDAVA